jgi:hypothetical protein
MSAGTRLDVRDRNFVWCRAIIKRIIYKDGRQKYAVVHFLDEREQFD